jgi:hypothetical protein
MGESLGRGPHGYRVRIVYSEPEFHRRNPHCPETYSSVFDLPEAETPEVAVRAAEAHFSYCAYYSGVSWRRVIKSITVER